MPDAVPQARTTTGFVEALQRAGASLVLSTRPDKLVFLSAEAGRLRTEVVAVDHPFGLAVGDARIAVASRRAVTVFASNTHLAARHPSAPGAYDAYFTPRTVHFTGECSMHDMVFSGRDIIGVNTSFSCLCRVDGMFSFTPLWRPPFITAMRPQDRCHLNGMAAEGGEPRYATALARSDTPEGWREAPSDRGLLMSCEDGRILRDDLCMPHSPRLHSGSLYLLNGGEGEVLKVDRATGASRRLIALPGFAHGLCEAGGVFFVGLSQDRVSRRRGEPPPVARRSHLIAGVAAVEIASGALLGLVEAPPGVTEVYDVQALPGVLRPGLQAAGDGGPVAVDTPEAVLWMQPRDPG